jgi:hypothetical protein
MTSSKLAADTDTCPRCGRIGIFGYHNQEGALIWYCGQHRLGRFYADARRVETIETEARRDTE